MRYSIGLGAAILGMSLLTPATRCMAQAAPVNTQASSFYQNGDWQDRDHDRDDHDYDHDRDHDRDRYNGQVPQGSYVDTCRDVRVNGSRLEATCQKKNGEWRSTSLDDVQTCSSEIVNDNGHLRCNR